MVLHAHRMYLRLCAPGFILIGLQLTCLMFPELFLIFNPIYLWVSLATIGIPCILATILVWVGQRYRLFEVPTLVWLAGLLVVLTLPSLLIFVKTWLYFSPDAGPALGYMGIFYFGTAPIWLPLLILWSWFSLRKNSQTSIDEN